MKFDRITIWSSFDSVYSVNHSAKSLIPTIKFICFLHRLSQHFSAQNLFFHISNLHLPHITGCGLPIFPSVFPSVWFSPVFIPFFAYHLFRWSSLYMSRSSYCLRFYMFYYIFTIHNLLYFLILESFVLPSGCAPRIWNSSYYPSFRFSQFLLIVAGEAHDMLLAILFSCFCPVYNQVISRLPDCWSF